MKQRIQNRIIARSVNATVVMFVIQLFLLFDKTESVNQVNQVNQVSQVIPLIPPIPPIPPIPVIPPIPRSLAKLHLSVSQSLASEEFLISGVSRLYDELCSQLCEIIPALNEKILARSASQLKN